LITNTSNNLNNLVITDPLLGGAGVGFPPWSVPCISTSSITKPVEGAGVGPLLGGVGVGYSLDFSGEACLTAGRLLLIMENEKLRISNRLMKVKKNQK
jgi:hypothetical protein